MTKMSTITSKRQLTIPAELFNRAGLKIGEKVIVTEKDGELIIKSAIRQVEELAGSVLVPKKFRGLSEDKILRKAKEIYFKRKIK